MKRSRKKNIYLYFSLNYDTFKSHATFFKKWLFNANALAHRMIVFVISKPVGNIYLNIFLRRKGNRTDVPNGGISDYITVQVCYHPLIYSQNQVLGFYNLTQYSISISVYLNHLTTCFLRNHYTTKVNSGPARLC